MKNYYDYGCGKGENHFYPHYEENQQQGAIGRDYEKHDEGEKRDSYERNDYYNYSFGDNSHEKDDHKERYRCENCCSEHCARVYSMKKHDCKCEYNHHDEHERYNKHSNCDEDKRHDKHSYCNEHKRYDECKSSKDNDDMDYGERKNTCFCFGICIPPFPFRCGNCDKR